MEPYVGQIQTFAFSWPPRGYALCDGQLMSISQNTALYSLIGTTYGGDGRTTFALPDLRGRAAIHEGTGPGLSPRIIGSHGGAENVTLTTPQIPSHSHTPETHCQSGTANSPSPVGNYWAAEAGGSSATYHNDANEKMNAGAVTIGNTGGSQSHNNMQPFLTIQFSIALVGVYPSRN